MKNIEENENFDRLISDINCFPNTHINYLLSLLLMFRCDVPG